MAQSLAEFSSFLSSAHRKIASIHLELANQLQGHLIDNCISRTSTSPSVASCSSDSTWVKINDSDDCADTTAPLNVNAKQHGTIKINSHDDDFEDSPILLNANALHRVKAKQRGQPPVKKLKKKVLSDAPKRPFTMSGYMVFQAENRKKVGCMHQCQCVHFVTSS
jgi:hypothetical protein